MPDNRSVILVGHCMPDKFMLRSAVKRVVPGVEIVTVNDAEKLANHASSHVREQRLDRRRRDPGHDRHDQMVLANLLCDRAAHVHVLLRLDRED